VKRLLRAAVASCAFLALLISVPARAQLTIEITGAGGNQIPIAIVPFAGEGALTPALSEVIESDLSRSGRFRTIYTGPQSLTDQSNIDFAPWREKNAAALVVGGVYPIGGGRSSARLRSR